MCTQKNYAIVFYSNINFLSIKNFDNFSKTKKVKIWKMSVVEDQEDDKMKMKLVLVGRFILLV